LELLGVDENVALHRKRSLQVRPPLKGKIWILNENDDDDVCNVIPLPSWPFSLINSFMMQVRV